MPIAAQSRETLRQIIGRNVGGSRFVLGTTTSTASDATSVIDNARLAYFANDELIGFWIRATSGTNDGETRRATDSVTTTGDVTTAAFGANVPACMTFEAWPPEFNPDVADRAINNAIISSYGRGYAPLENESLHTGGGILRFALPSTFSYLSKILQRTAVSSRTVHTCEAAFDESVPTGVSNATDTRVLRKGASSLKFTVTAAAAANALITDSITSTDYSDMTHLECWMKSNITTTAGDIHILLDNTASCVSPLETLAVPALTADTWTFVRIALAAQEDLTAIISVGIRFTTDNGAQVLYVDEIECTNENTARWEPFSFDAWRVDTANRGFYFTVPADCVGCGLLRLVGGQEPQTLTTDSATTTVDDDFIIAKATAEMFAQAHSDRYKKCVEQWETRAALAYRAVSRPVIARFLT